MKKIIILIMLPAVLFIGACGEFLDVNHDPNNTEESTKALVFPAGVENTANVFGGSWQILGSIWSQHWTSEPNAPQFQGEDRYEVQAGDYNYDLRGWEYLYTRSLMDYEWVKLQAKADQDWNYYLMANVMQAYTYQVLIDFFDQIPFSGALQKEPAAFEPGEKVYDSLIVRLDEALAKDFDAPTCTKPGNADLLFNGAMNDWVRFANTLKLKLYLRQRFANPTTAQEGIQALFDEGAEFIDKNAEFSNFLDESGRDNYCYAIEFRGGSINMCASKTILDYLVDEGDQRIDTMFTEGTGGYKGMYQGDIRNQYSYDTEPETYSKPIITPIQPVVFMSAVETKLMLAEIALVYGLGGDAETLYQEAVDMDFDRKGIKLEGGDTPDYKTFNGDQEHDLEILIVEKWVALANTQGMETYFEHNRTGYPRESDVLISDDNFATQYTEGEFIVSASGVLPPSNPYPKRLLLPSSEESKNPNFPGREPIYEPVWWDVRDYPY
ncbi:MAG: SusD/RagB family nutrient-binding outer membrane lipoprotein [Bacteroidota bacterium]|nr:SusD/RagB family nutrient-binding outer membrane lipoprotein [Bacteroidota bacterium]